MSDVAERSPWEVPLPADEFERLVARALEELDGPEGKEMADFMAWFKRRYPTPLDRLRFSSRKYREAMKLRGIAHRSRSPSR